MNARTLSALCGTILSVAAIAQPTTPQDSSRSRDSDRQRSATDSERRSDNSANHSSAFARENASQAESVLQRLEGVWKVDVSINPDAWAYMGDKNATWRQSQSGSQNSSLTKPATPDNDQTNQNNTDRNRDNQDDSQRSTMRDVPEGASRIKQTAFTGFAETKLVLGDNVLQEKLIMPDMKKSMGRAANSTTNGLTDDNSMSDEKDFRGISYISFDKDSNAYTIVFLDNCSGKVFHDTGTYDATSRRIVFNGKDVGNSRGMGRQSTNGNGDTDRGIDTTNTGRNADDNSTNSPNNANNDGTSRDTTDRNRRTGDNTTGTPGSNNSNTTDADRGRSTSTNRDSTARDRGMNDNAGTSGARAYYHGDGKNHEDMDNVRVVLDIIGLDEYRVTMYKVSESEAAGWTPPSGKDGRDNRTLPARNARGNSTSVVAPDATGNVIYIATYTKAQGGEKNRFERLLNDE